jgi:hypothetical protein
MAPVPSFRPCSARALVAWAGSLVLFLMLAQGATAQDLGTDCELREYGSIRSTEAAPGTRVTWLGDPFLVCPDGTRIRSDSAVVYEQTRRAELIGNVNFETEIRRLQSQLADYYEREGRLFARGEVTFSDLERGSVVRGDTLTYLGVTDFRSEEQVTVTGGRPEATLEPPTDRVDPDRPLSPYRVTGNRLRFEGDQFFWADGDVEVRRDDLEAYADSLAFDQNAGQLFLTKDARVVGEAEMEGQQINLTIPEDVVEQITIRNRGRLWTADLDLVGEEIRITFQDEKIQRLVAVHREGSDSDDPPPRPRVVTEDFVLEADSLDVQSPDEVLETVHAVGRARGETLARGQAPVPMEIDPDVPLELQDLPLDPAVAPEAVVEDDPEAQDPQETPDEPAVQVDRDWIEGDRILATFEPEPLAPADVAGEDQDPDAEDPLPDADELPEEMVVSDPEGEDRARYRLTRLESEGNARTLYRSPPEDGPPTRNGEPLWSISYIIAEEIAIFLTEGEVERVEARDRVSGVQLEPDRGEFMDEEDDDEDAEEPADEDGSSDATGGSWL